MLGSASNVHDGTGTFSQVLLQSVQPRSTLTFAFAYPELLAHALPPVPVVAEPADPVEPEEAPALTPVPDTSFEESVYIIPGTGNTLSVLSPELSSVPGTGNTLLSVFPNDESA